MARFIRWKETVALNVLLPPAIFILTFINIHDAIAQSRPVKSTAVSHSTNRITYSCRAIRFESVMDYLSKHSGYDFIYSSDLVDTSRPVSLSVKDKSINEVLSLIERQLNVSFKLQDRHIIVKNNPKHNVVLAQPAPEHNATQVFSPTFKTTDGLLISSVGKSIPLQPRQSHTSLLQGDLDRRINELQSLLGPGVPRDIPQFYISQINFNNRNRGWFGAIGTFVGDHSSGLELQAGLPYLYAVVHPRWTMDQGFTGAYGVGNSINLTGNFSFNTIYMYSGQTRIESTYPFSPPTLQMGPEFRRTEAVRHHQVRMAVQYAFSETLSIRGGPVLNYQNTIREFVVVPSTAFSEGNFTYRQEGGNGNVAVVYQNGQFGSTSKTTRTFESWIGWEASLTYRIIFLRRR